MDWTSPEDKKHFVQVTKELGTMVLGSTTFDTIGRALPGRRMIVMTSRPEAYEVPGVETFTGSAQDLVSELESEGVPALAVIGGAGVYGQFLAAGLADELMLTVEPHVFGRGITLADADLDLKLRLLDTQKLGENSIVIQYEVER